LDESSKAVVKKLREWAGDLARAIGNKQKCMNLIQDEDDPAARKLEALLGPFTRKFRFLETMSMKNTVLTDFSRDCRPSHSYA
jgi:hypothetical protein